MAVRILSEADGRALDAALHGAVVLGRDDLVAVVATGRDHARFLHNMLTQEVKALPPLSVRLACLCDAQGKMLAASTLVVQPEQNGSTRAVLWTHRQQAAALVATLDRYVIADDVEIALDETLALVSLVGPEALRIVGAVAVSALQPPDPKLELGDAVAATVAGVSVLAFQGTTGGREGAPHGPGVPEIFLQLQRDDVGTLVPALLGLGAVVGCHAAAEALRILAGRPLLGVDVDDASLPLEAGLAASVSYRKGCYLGQEAIAMMTYRGQMRRHLCWVEPAASGPLSAGTGAMLPGPGLNPVPDAGALLRTTDGKRAGRMGSSVVLRDGRCLGLAMVQRKAYAAGAELTATGPDGGEVALRLLTTTVLGALAVAAVEGEPTASSAPAALPAEPSA